MLRIAQVKNAQCGIARRRTYAADRTTHRANPSRPHRLSMGAGIAPAAAVTDRDALAAAVLLSAGPIKNESGGDVVCVNSAPAAIVST